MINQTLYIGRQPILDAKESLFGYELLFRTSTDDNIAVFPDDVTATTRVMATTLNNIGIQNLVGSGMGFINANHELLNDEILELLPKESFILEILENSHVDDLLVERLSILRKKGYRIALDDFLLEESAFRRFSILFPQIDYIKIEVLNCNDDQLHHYLPLLKAYPNIRLLAEKVESKAMFERCRSFGFDYFQGYYFAKPEIIANEGVLPTSPEVSRLMNLLLSNAEPEHITKAFKETPSITINLLKYMNSVSFGLKAEIRSIHHAIMLLGQRKLFQWVTLLSYANSGKRGADAHILQMVQFRAKGMELLAPLLKGRSDFSEEEAFMIGFLSMLDAIFSMPLEKVLQEFSIDEEIKRILLTEETVLGELLRLIKHLERDELESINHQCAKLGIPVSKIISKKIQAIHWADETSRLISS